MDNKVILISIDGMRPDGFLNCGNPFIKELMARSTYTLTGSTVFPSVTLPCHMSMFHSVSPSLHGITTNLYMPPVRPVNGLFEQINNMGGICGMYYGWEPLRDVSRPESLKYAYYLNAYIEDDTDSTITDEALKRIRKSKPDFVFLYMVETDQKGGHMAGWMSQGYRDVVSNAIRNVQRVWEEFGEEYTIVITADHGGHDRTHGTEMPEDMTIPLFFLGKRFGQGVERNDISILDIAPTIADVMGLPKPAQWEGKSIAQ